MPVAALAQTKTLLGITDTDSDTQITEFLKLGSIFVNYKVAKVSPTMLPGGVQNYLEFETPDQRLRWFASITLVTDSSYNELAPDTVDLNNGRWTFVADQEPILLIRGRSYDPNGAAADWLRSQSGSTAGDLTSFSTSGGNFAFADNAESFANAMKRFESQRRRMPIEINRSDINA